jgi:hypothetical protein
VKTGAWYEDPREVRSRKERRKEKEEEGGK